MPQVESLADQVRYNCDISDARHAGLFSICGLALRLRGLYTKGLKIGLESENFRSAKQYATVFTNRST